MSDRRILDAGDRALLVELADLVAALGFYSRLSALQNSARSIVGVTEILPAARTVLVNYLPRLIDRNDLAARLDAIESTPTDGGDGRLVTIDVVYDGADLSEVAEILGVTADEVIAMHTGAEYRAAFAGFAPGFVYLTGGDPRLDVPRRSSPRTRIPAGSVGLAGTFSGVYPRESPGGWQLIGHTPQRMWVTDREPPALVSAGDRVRFAPVDNRPSEVAAAPPPRTQQQDDPPISSAALVIDRPGLQPLLQDEGRPGHGNLGVSAGGAVDLPAMRLANRLVGNPTDTAVLELPYGGLSARARGPIVVAVTGARTPVTVRRGDHRINIVDQRPIALDDGDELRIGAPAAGFRVNLAVRGGFAVDPVLGSLSTDTLAGLGPDPIGAGDVLTVGTAPTVAVGVPEPWPADPPDDVVLPIRLGPRDDWFAATSVRRLTEQAWTVTDHADRVGLRLHGEEPLVRDTDGELPSEGAVTGSIQVPPSGQPMVFLADHPLTGGYPIIGVVLHDALPQLAQARPGTRIRFAFDHQETPCNAY